MGSSRESLSLTSETSAGDGKWRTLFEGFQSCGGPWYPFEVDCSSNERIGEWTEINGRAAFIVEGELQFLILAPFEWEATAGPQAAITRRGGDSITIAGFGAPGHRCQLEFIDSLNSATWQPIADTRAGVDGRFEFTRELDSQRMFFRVSDASNQAEPSSP
jgi:hypothetical protein